MDRHSKDESAHGDIDLEQDALFLEDVNEESSLGEDPLLVEDEV
jgi:hypothetical protein